MVNTEVILVLPLYVHWMCDLSVVTWPCFAMLCLCASLQGIIKQQFTWIYCCHRQCIILIGVSAVRPQGEWPPGGCCVYWNELSGFFFEGSFGFLWFWDWFIYRSAKRVCKSPLESPLAGWWPCWFSLIGEKTVFRHFKANLKRSSMQLLTTCVCVCVSWSDDYFYWQWSDAMTSLLLISVLW